MKLLNTLHRFNGTGCLCKSKNRVLGYVERRSTYMAKSRSNEKKSQG